MLGRYVPIARARFPGYRKERDSEMYPNAMPLFWPPQPFRFQNMPDSNLAAILIPGYSTLLFSGFSNRYVNPPSSCTPKLKKFSPFFNGWNFSPKREILNFKKNSKISDFGGFQSPEVRENTVKYHHIPTLWCSVCSQNLEGWLKFVLHIWFIARFGEIFSGYSWFSEI
jgi:hypothetical protein